MFRSALALISVFSLGFSAMAHAEHREHGAHVHGKGTLAIGFEDKKGEIDFTTAAIGIVGFEHDATSAKDKKTKDDAFAKFESQIGKMIQLDPSLNCKLAKKTMAMQKDSDGDHSDFIAAFTVECAKSPIGSTVTFDFSMWPGLHDVDGMVLAGALQKSVEIKQKPVKLLLK